jgi:DNA polymerase elongation subunit (family B)
MRSIGFDMGINLSNHEKKQEMYFLSYTSLKKIQENVIKKIIDKGITDDYVYDLETEIGRFGVGVGQLHGYNTDSVFLSLKYNRQDFNKNRADTFKLATICGDNLTEKVFKRPPVEMEFEKVFQPFILLTKKRYIGKKYENMKDPFKLKEITKSGIAITRRDYCKMVKNCYSEVINVIVNEDGGDVDESVKIYKNYIDRIDNYQIDIEDLVVSAMLAKSYKTKPVHVHLAEKLKARHEEVQVGDRIPYIYIESNDPTIPKSELGEDPKYAVEHNLKFNRKCYLEQLAKPLLGFFKCVLNDNEESLDDIINYTNEKLVEYGGAKLKPSDFKMKEDD